MLLQQLLLLRCNTTTTPAVAGTQQCPRRPQQNQSKLQYAGGHHVKCKGSNLHCPAPPTANHLIEHTDMQNRTCASSCALHWLHTRSVH